MIASLYHPFHRPCQLQTQKFIFHNSTLFSLNGDPQIIHKILLKMRHKTERERPSEMGPKRWLKDLQILFFSFLLHLPLCHLRKETKFQEDKSWESSLSSVLRFRLSSFRSIPLDREATSDWFLGIFVDAGVFVCAKFCAKRNGRVEGVRHLCSS